MSTMKTEVSEMVSAVEVLSSLPGSTGRRVVDVELPRDIVTRVIGSRGQIEAPCNLYGAPAVIVRDFPHDAIDELVCELRAAERSYRCTHR